MQTKEQPPTEAQVPFSLCKKPLTSMHPPQRNEQGKARKEPRYLIITLSFRPKALRVQSLNSHPIRIDYYFNSWISPSRFLIISIKILNFLIITHFYVPSTIIILKPFK